MWEQINVILNIYYIVNQICFLIYLLYRRNELIEGGEVILFLGFSPFLLIFILYIKCMSFLAISIMKKDKVITENGVIKINDIEEKYNVKYKGLTKLYHRVIFTKIKEVFTRRKVYG